MRFLFFILFCLPVILSSQIRVLSTEKLEIGTSEQWSNPVFSPDGKKIFLTNSAYNGIWEFDLNEKVLTNITRDPGSGYGFSVSKDDQKIAYRRTIYAEQRRERIQEIIMISTEDRKEAVVEKNETLSLPVFSGKSVIHSRQYNGTAESPLASSTEVLGIENTKILLIRNGKKVLLDPIAEGSYIWPVLSPGKDRIAAYEMSKGTFICDLEGNIISMLGRRNAAVWSGDGKWLIYMDDKDDGHRITGSEIMAVSADGKTTLQLTDTREITEMFPNVSPAGNKIVLSSNEGDVYLITYTVD